MAAQLDSQKSPLHKTPFLDKAMKNTEELASEIVANLSSLILAYSNRLASEQSAPDSNPDRSDDYIKAHQKKIQSLRKIRENFEDTYSGAIL